MKRDISIWGCTVIVELLTYELVYAAAVEVTCDIQSHIQCYLFDIHMAIRFSLDAECRSKSCARYVHWLAEVAIWRMFDMHFRFRVPFSMIARAPHLKSPTLNFKQRASLTLNL